MSTGTTRSPLLPFAPDQYDRQYRQISCPTDAEYGAGLLRTGDIYYDTTTFALKIVP